MKIFLLIFIILIIAKPSISNNLFDTQVYELKFKSQNIITDKENKINKIKSKSFKLILKNTLNEKDYNNFLKSLDLKLVNFFILNITINNEKIVANNYYSEIKINFNKRLIIDYFIQNKINFVENIPNKFLIIIYEEDELESNLLSKKNNYYNYLINVKINKLNKFLFLPNLDFNDRYLFNKEDFNNNSFYKILELNKKYNTKYQIIINSKLKNKIYDIKAYLKYNDNLHPILDTRINKINYFKFFETIVSLSIDKWKYLNQINTSLVTTLDCKIYINNINELKFVTSLLNSNSVIKKFYIKTIDLNKNVYNISYFGNLDILKESLKRNRLDLNIINNECNIKLK